MSNYDINSNPALVKLMIENAKKAMEKYFAEHPDSLIPLFEQELRELGYGFEIPDQIKGFLPRHKDIILPMAIRYYQQVKYHDEKKFFMSFFHFKGFEEVVPMLLEDFYSPETPNSTRSFIAENLRVIRSKKYVEDYLKILSDTSYGESRFAIMNLIGKLKVEAAIPMLIKMLDEERSRTHAICALGDYKREELQPYFERFENDKNSYWRKYARAALKKLEKQLEKRKDSS